MGLSCQPHLPPGLGVECNSLNVRLTCNGRQLQTATIPTLPLYIRNVSLAANTSSAASVDFKFPEVTPELNAADCLCIVKYSRRNSNVTSSDKQNELLSSLRLVVFYPPNDVQIQAEPPLPWLLPNEFERDINTTTKFRLKCSVGVTGNPGNVKFVWKSGNESFKQSLNPAPWSSVLQMTDLLDANRDNGKVMECSAKNDAGNSEKAKIKLSLYGTPLVAVKMIRSGQLVDSKQTLEVREGAMIALRCLATVTGATPEPHRFIWRRDNVLLSMNSPELVIPAASAGHAGTYQCQVAVDTET